MERRVQAVRSVIICALVVALLAAGVASADDADPAEPSFHYYPYTIRQGGCSARSFSELASHRYDPVNVVFYDHAATQHTFNVVYERTRWQYPDGEQEQWFWQFDRRLCRQIRLGLKEHPDDSHICCHRAHLRFLQMVQETLGDPADPRYRWVTAGAMRLEDPATCSNNETYVTTPANHGGTQLPGGYVEGKVVLGQAFRGYTRMYFFSEGNSQPLRQCDGTHVHDNGNQLWIRIP
jgi:hypothetical protein